MTARDALREGAAALQGSETPFLDASLLLADLLSSDAAGLYAALPETLDDEVARAYRERLARRAGGTPVAYVLGRKEFWGRSFAIDPRALIPRPDTELLVETALALGDSLPGPSVRVHEGFCGSGCVALSLAADRPAWEVTGSDLSEGALELARENEAAMLGAPRSAPGAAPSAAPSARFFLSDVLSSAPGPYDLVLANPPYVESEEAARLLALGWGEPAMALDGGPDGLDLVRELAPQAMSRIAPGGWLLVEADPSQGPQVARILGLAGFGEVGTFADLGGRPRVTVGRKPWRT